MSKNLAYFSSSYKEATERIHTKATQLGLKHTQLQLSNGLVINTYQKKVDSKKSFLLTSGIHGVEGFLGSALQLSFLDQLGSLRKDTSLILIHIVNPFGMKNNRRWNESNVDLNRNFWTSLPNVKNEAYHKLSGLINPDKKSKLPFFGLKSLFYILKHGFKPLQQAIAQGQYFIENGLFYGGNEPSEETDKVVAFLNTTLSSTKQLFSIDIHCGLGKFGKETLLLEPNLPNSTKLELESKTQKPITQVNRSSADNYKIMGGFINRLTDIVGINNNKSITLEIGTSKPIKILKALRKENYYFNHSSNKDALLKAQQGVKNHFYPQSNKWKIKAIENGLGTIINLYNSI